MHDEIKVECLLSSIILTFSFLLEFYFISLLSCMISFLLCDMFLKTNGLKSEMRRVGPW